MCTQRDAPKVRGFIQMMEQVCPQMGIRVCKPQMIELQNDRTETYLNALRTNINSNVSRCVNMS